MTTEKKNITSEDTKEFILYVFKQEKNSVHAWGRVKATPSFAQRCIVKDISRMGEIPAFLLGVPCFYDVNGKRVFHGSMAIEKIEAETKATFIPLTTGAKRGNSSLMRLPPSFNTDNAPTFDGKIDDDVLKQYMAARNPN